MGPLPVMNRTLEKARPNNQNKIKGLLPTLMLVVGLLDVIVIFGSGKSFDKERRPAVSAIGLCQYLGARFLKKRVGNAFSLMVRRCLIPQS